ncbi:MAG: prepilin-type N-terminal cleavage/methylation domain-containing protein [Bacillota bacterium]
MISYIQRQLKNKKGFTLVELMVVVGIIGVLVAIAIPVYNNATEKAANVANDANIRTIKGAISLYEATEGTLPGKGTDFYGLVPKYLMEEPKNPYGSDDEREYVITKDGDNYKVTLGEPEA